jgi:tRNA(Ile)-lysidine synthase
LIPRTRIRVRLRRVEPVLRRALRGRCALPPGSTLLVAASGGADSTALLCGLARLAHEFDLGLHAAHLHHGLRGADADADLAAVRALCERLNVPLTAARWDTKRRMKALALSGQDGLRRLRTRFLAEAARRAGAVAIATAHTADDQLETLLLRLARGAGLRGLGAMRERSGRRIKPLLEATRADIEADLVRAGIEWREDASNDSLDYARNRIRHQVVPALVAAAARDGKSRPNPGPAAGGGQAHSSAARARAGLARRAARAAAEARSAERTLAQWVERRLSRAYRIQGREIRFDSKGVATYPPAARRIALRMLWNRLDGPREGLTLRHLDALLRLTEKGTAGATVQLPGGWRASRERDTISFQPGRDRPRTARIGSRPR